MNTSGGQESTTFDGSDDHQQQQEGTPSRQAAPHQRQDQASTRHQKRYLGLARKAIITIMNAAVTIFGLGVGVGLILGDSLRHNAPEQVLPATAATAAVPARPAAPNETPSCSSGMSRNAIQAPPQSSAAALLPAQ